MDSWLHSLEIEGVRPSNRPCQRAAQVQETCTAHAFCWGTQPVRINAKGPWGLRVWAGSWAAGFWNLSGRALWRFALAVLRAICVRYACENVNKLLVGNKSDLEAKRAVTTEEAKVRGGSESRGGSMLAYV